MTMIMIMITTMIMTERIETIMTTSGLVIDIRSGTSTDTTRAEEDDDPNGGIVIIGRDGL